jgi:CubicO group peptidase (beta-lactamase class C family)
VARLSDRSTRRAVMLAGVAAGGALAMPTLSRSARAGPEENPDKLFAELDAKISQGMQDFSIPGAVVGVFNRGRSYLRGYGVTNITQPAPVDADTVFRIASTSKTFTGTAAMAPVNAGKLALDQPVRSYLTDFVAPEAQDVTVRQVLNHSAGWLGYDYHDTGSDAGALARYVNDVRKLPRLTPVGTTFSYNNAGISVAGRVIETVTGETYESSLQHLLFEPLGLERSLFSEDLPGIGNVAMPHDFDTGKPLLAADMFHLPRSANPFGGVLSCARDQLAYLRFHLGDGRAANGRRVMGAEALRAMWARPGPGGTLFVELVGAGVSWMIRPTAAGVTVVQHGGDLPGFHSGFIMVPERQFGMTLLTNSERGPLLLAQLFTDDWALRRFAGVSNLPATPRTLSATELAPFEGVYSAEQIGFTGPPFTFEIKLQAKDGALAMSHVGDDSPPTRLTFYKDDFAIVQAIGMRANFLRAPDGSVAWFRLGGRLFRHMA